MNLKIAHNCFDFNYRIKNIKKSPRFLENI